jgi:hypothetical protein
MDWEETASMNTPEILTKYLYNFIEGLRLAGYNIGTAQFIAAQDIILALVAQGELPQKLSRLRTLLSGVLCHSPKEQEEFGRHFDNWMSQIELLVIPEVKKTPEMEAASSTLSETKMIYKTQALAETKTTRIVRKIKEPIITLWQWILSRVASILRAILQGLLKLWESQTQRFLVRKVTLTRPRIEYLFVKGLEEEIFQSVNLTSIAKHLRTDTPISKKQLDIEQTVEKTTQAAGLFTPVIDSIKTIPHYLVLIDKVSYKDHQTHLVDVLINQLIAKGVLITRYYFHIEPRACYPEQEPLIPLSIDELGVLYPKHRLMIFSDGSGLIDASTNQVVHWISQFSVWLQRTLFTLETPWGYREHLLENVGFIIMQANEVGLAAFAEQISTNTWYSYPNTSKSVSAAFPVSLIKMPEKWLYDHAPDAAVFTELLIQLWDFLGKNGYYWLSACAVYPELHWQLTLYLGYQLTSEDGNKLFSKVCLAKLVRLPWFRYGYMPDWLRERLVNDLSLSQEREIRTALHNLLLTALDKPSQGFFPLEIAKPTRATLAVSAQQLLQHLKLSKHDAKDNYVLRDYVFPTFMASSLAVKIPKMLRSLLVEPQSIETLRATKATTEIAPLEKSSNISLEKSSNNGISQQHLREEITRLKQRYELLTQKIGDLKQQKQLETRIGKILYLRNLIDETTAEHEQVKKGMSQLETLLIEELNKPILKKVPVSYRLPKKVKRFLGLLPYLVNREAQKQKLYRAIHHIIYDVGKRRILLCLIHGDIDEYGDFIESMCAYFLPKYLPNYFENTVETKLPLRDFHTVDELHQEMLACLKQMLSLFPDQPPKKDAIAKRLAREQRPIVVSTRLFTRNLENWQDDKKTVIDGFIEFWADWPEIPDKHSLFVVFLSINYKGGKNNVLSFSPKNWRRRKRLKAFNLRLKQLEALSNNNFPTTTESFENAHVVVLPQLKSVDKKSVYEWIKKYREQIEEYYHHDIYTLENKIDALYKNKYAIPMEELARELQKLLDNPNDY